MLILERKNKSKINPHILHQDNWALNSNGCWCWKFSKNTHGYANIMYQGKMVIVTRLLLDAEPGQDVRHNPGCDRSCIRLDHLKIGTRQDNTLDRIKDGKQRNQRLNYELAREIRAKYATGLVTQQDLADCYEVSRIAISHIINNRTWDPRLYEAHNR